MRASEMRTMSRTPCASSFCGMGRFPTSGIPGAPTGPAFCSTSTLSAVTSRSGSSIRAARSAREEKTTAGPRWRSRWGEAATCLITAPSGHRLPRRMASPPSGSSGAPAAATTSRSRSREASERSSGAGRRARFSATVSPGHGAALPVQQGGQLLHHRRDAPDLEQGLHLVATGRAEVGQPGRAAGEGVEEVERAGRSPAGRRWPGGAPRRWWSPRRRAGHGWRSRTPPGS